MIGEFEQYHGAALRELVVCARKAVTIEPKEELGRVNSYLVDGKIALHIKHSAKRLPPWQFTFNEDNVRELESLAGRAASVWLALVCGRDGLLCLSLSDFQSVNPRGCATTCFLRVDRDRRTRYRVNGTQGVLAYKPPRGLTAMIEVLHVQEPSE